MTTIPHSQDANNNHADEHYYIPHGSHWPVVGSVGLFFLMLGVSTWLNGADGMVRHGHR